MMINTTDELRPIVLKFIEQLEEQRSEVQLTELQKVMFLLQRLLKKDFVEYSIFNYGPYSLELERVLDDLLVAREVDRFGSRFSVAGAAPQTRYDDAIKNVIELLKVISPTEVQKACTVMYFRDSSENELEALTKAQSVSPKSEMDDFKKAYGALSDKLSMLAV